MAKGDADNLLAKSDNLMAGTDNLMAGTDNLMAGTDNLFVETDQLLTWTRNLLVNGYNLLAAEILHVQNKTTDDDRKEKWVHMDVNHNLWVWISNMQVLRYDD